MTLVVLRPNGTTSNTGTVTGAGGVAHTALSDDSDASYITFITSQTAVLTLGDLTLPAGAIVKNVSARVRAGTLGNPASLNVTVHWQGTGGPADAGGSVPVPGATITTYAAGSAVAGWTDPQVDAATLQLTWLSGTVRVYEAYFDVRIVNQPVVTVTAPTGTLTTTNLPTVTWTNALDSDGGAQTNYQVRVFTAAQYGIGGFDPATSPSTYDSGILSSSALSHALTTPLANATYRAYVRVAQQVNGGGFYSAFAFSGFIVNVTPPAVPTLALTPSNTLGRIQAVVTTGGGATSTDRVELQRSVDGGTTWTAVRNIETNDGTITYPAAPVTVLDYEAPNGTATKYRARALHNYSGLYAASSFSTIQTATWTATDWWIKHPNVPALNLKLTQSMFSYPDVVRAARMTAFQALGAALPVVVSDTRGAPAGTVVVQLALLADQNALDALLNTVSTLLLQGPVAEGQPDRYVRFGDHGSMRVADKGFSLITRETLPWTEVASPPGVQT